MKQNDRIRAIAQAASKEIDAKCIEVMEVKNDKDQIIGMNHNFHIRRAARVIEEAIVKARPTLLERLESLFKPPVDC